MRRREFLSYLGTAAAAWPLAARAQEPGRVYRLAILSPLARNEAPIFGFFDELKVNGFVEGRNLKVLPEGFAVPADRMDEVVEAIVKAAPDAIVAGPEPVLRALQARTRTIPIVGMAEDMVAGGFVASLAHPGGNTTGISLLSPELDGKRQEILAEAVPGLRRMTAFASTASTRMEHLEMLRAAARARGFELSTVGVDKPEQIGPAIDRAKASGAQALNFLATPLFISISHRQVTFEHVASARLPAIYQWPETAEEGGIMAYGPRLTEMYRQRARLLVRVLRGAKPAGVPVEQPTKFELIINLKTANALGLTVPPTLVARADKVIE